ncbi:unnamed protein product [Musa acuminata subsp. malaccensis]|uniref:(wild Malaysian banana) hypothetical protein n=1 Tax=Musa acuminata subsp. malaccensis TaxID=214687 RepID=A0A804K981_MUSAM|nr:PREDICTED: uncharacterized protein LOC103995459 [Musa acuminata subsp. malaccensis]CAG1832314.1 unnamed protein product [Musa acuminata subsp. malaccensis]
MEVKIPRLIDTKAGNERKKPSSRLQKQAPATLQLDATKRNTAFVMGADDAAASAPIPLLSPLLLSPSPLWDAEESNSAGEDKGDGGGSQTSSPASPPEGWHHPALPVAAMEPASLVPSFELQCSMVHHVQ